MTYALDTHSLVWFLTNDLNLGTKAKEILDKNLSDDIIAIPIIVLCEIMYISNRKRISISLDTILDIIKTS